tara:strand:+ start:54 stop:305 length:252 start_codon:yes stop_codon:yes gene_type:complete
MKEIILKQLLLSRSLDTCNDFVLWADISDLEALSEKIEEQLTTHSVSNRRELLKSFADWLQGEVWDDKHDDFSDYVEDYIKTL